MKKNFQITLPASYQEIKPIGEQVNPSISMRDATLSLWQTNEDQLLLQEFKGRYGYLYSHDTKLSHTLRIPVTISISDMHILYLMQASADVHLYTATEELICSVAPRRARYLYLPEGDYILMIPPGESHLFGFYYDGGLFRDGNERKFRFIHDLIDAYRSKSEKAMCSVELDVGKLTLLHVEHLCSNLRKGELDNEVFIVQNLLQLIDLSHVKYHMRYSNPNDKSHIAEYIRLAIQKQVEINGQAFNISELVGGMKYSQNYYNSLHKLYYGMTLHAYKVSLIIDKAKKYLSLGHSPVNCAYECGYTNLHVFSQFFKKQTGNSPMEYIRKIKHSQY